MFGSFSRSWELVKASWAVLKADRELLIFPAISTVGLIIVSIIFFIPLAASGIFQSLAESADSGVASSGAQLVGFVIAFLFYLVTYTIIIFSNVALVGAAMIRLDGGDPTVSDGFRIASERIGTILGYAAISATVGMILKAIQSSDNLLAKIAAGIFGIAWSLATYMVVPVLVMEDIGPIEAVKRSASLLKETWGEQVVGEFAIGSIFFLIGFAAALLIGLPIILIAINSSSVVLLVLGIGGLILLFAVIGLFSSALSGIYQAALYQYAAQGKSSEYFNEAMISGAFKPKR